MGIRNFINKFLKKIYSNKVFVKRGSSNTGFKVNIVNLAIALEHSGYVALIPSNLDINVISDRNSLISSGFFWELNGKIKCNTSLGSIFDKEGLIHIIDLLSSIPANYKDSITESGYVLMNSSY